MSSFKEPLLPIVFDCNIVSSDIEGSCKIKSITPIRLLKRRIALGLIISLSTALMFPLACSWSKKLTKVFFFRRVNIGSATHFWVVNDDYTYNICVKKIVRQSLYLMNRKLKYVYNEQIGGFKALEYSLDNLTKAQIFEKAITGIQGQSMEIYGPCKIDIPAPTLFAYMIKELTAPFYILQYISCALWTAENYALLAIVMITVSLVMSMINYFLLLTSNKKLRALAQNKQKVKVFRDGLQGLEYRVIDCSEIVPGDIIMIEAKQAIPCDCIVLSGDIVMNEASLTGESVPVNKNQLQQNEEYFSQIVDKKNCLFEGTKVLLTKPTQHQYVLALVIRQQYFHFKYLNRTGFSSFKGQIFRSVLYPKPQKFAFYNQGIKYFCGLSVFILIIYFAEIQRMIDLQFKPLIIVFRFGDAITWIIPPALPIFISMCMTYSLLRLRKRNIFGVDPLKTLVAGQINTLCFDKTGTLTSTSIDVFGYQMIRDNNGVKMLTQPFTSYMQSPQQDQLFKLFATCHGVAKIDGELLGDSLDIEMFKFSGYEIVDSSHDKRIKLRLQKEEQTLDILNMFDFESEFSRMSVLIRDNETNQYIAFCKGSPEKISELSLFQSVPNNFKANLDILTMKGMRVLGLSYKILTQEEFDEFQKDGRRHLLESNLQFCGILIMENKLKCDTADVILQLRRSGLDIKVISGDNGLTTVQCARECNIIDKGQPMLLVDYDDKSSQLILEEIDPILFNFNEKSEKYASESGSEDTEATQQQSQWNTHSAVLKKLVSHLLQSDHTIKSNHLRNNLTKNQSINQEDNFNTFLDTHGFAITGKAFDYFWSQSPISTYKSKKNSFAGFDEPGLIFDQLDIDDEQTQRKVFHAIIKQAKVFARMRPEQKSQIIEQLQVQGRTVAMIGDGANDCVNNYQNINKAAIKQANIGISFAQSDASYSAPFSSQEQSLDCVYHVLLDGRAASTNTIEVFQYYVYASVTKYIAAMLLALQGQNFSPIQMLFVNYVSTLPFLKTICITGPCQLLTNRIPIDDMFRLPNQITMYFHMAFTGMGLTLNYLYWFAQEWSTRVTVAEDGNYILEGQAQTTLFFCTQFYFFSGMIGMYISRPFKIPIYKHMVFIPLLTFLFSMAFYFFFSFNEWMYTILKIENLRGHKNYLRNQLFITLLVCATMILLQETVVKRFLPCHKPLHQRHHHKANQIKKVKVRTA